MPYIDYIEDSLDNLQILIKSNLILLITATDLESQELHRILSPFPGFKNIIKAYKGNLTYYFGTLGRYKIAHVQCSMGSISRDSSILTTAEALKELGTSTVIMPGIAFGVDSSKQNIGDVLIAEAVQPYNNKRVGDELEVQRAYATPSSKILFNRFKNLKSWEYLVDDSTKAKLIFSVILSGEELIDNKKHRDELSAKFPNAAGGEMEGAGVYAACDGIAQCILVKGICDFADGLKGLNKQKNQITAIESALSVCVDLFSSQTAFTELGISPFEEHTIIPNLNIKDVNSALFEIYDPTKEEFYLQREADKNFIQSINYYGIWIFGISGCGKSSLISRNLIQSKVEYIQVNLASSVGLSIESFFSEILFEVASKTEGIQAVTQPKGFPECVRLLLNLLNKHYNGKELVIFIEEIPLDNTDSNEEFAQKMYSLLVSKALVPSLANVRFILSSINNPTIHIQTFNQKIHSQLKFIELNNWTTQEIGQLFDLVNNKFRLEISSSFKAEIITKSKHSPRFLKKYFRNILSINRFDTVTINEALLETERELNIMN